MCIALPMRLLEGNLAEAFDGTQRSIDLSLTGPLPAGGWVLVHIDTALRPLDPEEAGLIGDALAACALAAAGQPFAHLFADLIDREPELPVHLRPNHEPTECATPARKELLHAKFRSIRAS